jgi:DNA modification methylase
MLNPISEIRKKIEDIPVSEEWCFKNVRSTEQWTHGYHRYPAKFLPNLVKKLIEDYTHPEETIADLFAGCGTTLVEAKIHGRPSIGVDINPVAELITKAKTKPIQPIKLSKKLKELEVRFLKYDSTKHKALALHERIDYWFLPEHKCQIAFLYERIFLLHDADLRTFFLVALSNILKNCSRWLQSSTKPQIDPNKKPADPFVAFKRQAKQMIKKNKEFYDALKKDNFILTNCEIRLEDARNTTITSNSIGTIITSPPYVTSYEYADIHQLTGFWYDYISDLKGFRKKFIGTFYSLKQETNCISFVAQEIINDLFAKDKRKAKEVANYFNDMYAVIREMHRILKPEGHACLVIGNTTFLDVKIKSAEVFIEFLELSGFNIIEIIKRSIPYKLIPTIRDEKSGKFAKLEQEQSKLVYPEEYIIVAKRK